MLIGSIVRGKDGVLPSSSVARQFALGYLQLSRSHTQSLADLACNFCNKINRRTPQIRHEFVGECIVDRCDAPTPGFFVILLRIKDVRSRKSGTKAGSMPPPGYQIIVTGKPTDNCRYPQKTTMEKSTEKEKSAQRGKGLN